jgi:hypothetical protein
MKQIDVLPDDVLLEIFDFYTSMDPLGVISIDESKKVTEVWQLLVHVCRRWRSLVFLSPRRLNLQLCCTPKTPARDTLDVWPALPLVIKDVMEIPSSMDNIIAALGQSNRVCQVNLMHLADSQLDEVLAVMQVPFPELAAMQLSSQGGTAPVIPDSFLGGSAPALQFFESFGVPFPGLPKLLLSATNLVHLGLYGIPHSGYISPNAIVTLLSVLSSLEALVFSNVFEPPESRPDWESRSLPPPKRFILPTLHDFWFTGVTEYLEELVTRIDAPQLLDMRINLVNQIDFDCPRLAEFIHRTPTLRARDRAHVEFDYYSTRISVTLQARSKTLEIGISCGERDRQLSSVARVCNSSLPPLPTVEDLYIERRQLESSQLVWINNDIENTLWLELLLPFTAVKNLYLSKEFAPDIATVLQELVGDRMTEVLPSLQNIFVEGLEPSGLFQENIGQFVAARQRSDHPIALSDWEKDSNMEPV